MESENSKHVCDIHLKLVTTVNLEIFDETYEEFRTTVADCILFGKFETRWYNCKESWALFGRCSNFYLRNSKYNQTESMNHKLKLYIPNYSKIYVFDKS